MALVTSRKHLCTVIWVAVALLLASVLGLSFHSYAVDAGQDKSSSSAASSESADSNASSSTSAATSSSASETGGSVPISPRSEVDVALAQSAAPSQDLDSIDADSAGTLFTFTTPLDAVRVGGDLYWAGQHLELDESKVGNDVLAIGFRADFRDADVGNDVRVAGQQVHLENVIVQDYVDILALEASIDKGSAARGYYFGGGTIKYEGKSKRFIAYGQSIYFDGVVEGDVTLSAQDIVIGPNAKVTGTLDIRSGQTLEGLAIPGTAEIAHIDTTLNQPNTIDQITQIRAAIAPYFQVGTMLFLVVSFVLLALALLWGFGNKMSEANRLIRRYPLAVVVLGCIALMLMFVIIMLGTLLVFTIPFSIVVALILLISAICCIPFTGASLMLMLRKRLRPWLCVVLGSGLGAVLVFIPYVNLVVFAASLIYFVGYMVNIAMFGHDKHHDAAFHRREHEGAESAGRTSGILPVNDYAPVSVPIVDDAGTGIEIDANELLASGGESDRVSDEDAEAPVEPSGEESEGDETPGVGNGDEEAKSPSTGTDETNPQRQ